VIIETREGNLVLKAAAAEATPLYGSMSDRISALDRDGIYISDLMLYELGPFDRVFVTTARRHRLPIVTSRQHDTLVRALKKKAAEKDGASDSAHPFESRGG
jgi:PIN domain nuclease of toxin-antitoxin system